MSRYVTTIVGDMASGFVVTNRYVSSGGGSWTPTPGPILAPDTNAETDSGLDGGNNQNNTGTKEDSKNNELNN